MEWLIQATVAPEPGTVAVVEPASGTRTRTALGDAANDWLCAWCLQRVANENDRFQYEGRSEFTFLNPQGIRFDILTFGQTMGCRSTGTPTLEHTWFPHHAWSYCLCDGCGRHLGWLYTGPSHFAGLIRDRIVRALPLMN